MKTSATTPAQLGRVPRPRHAPRSPQTRRCTIERVLVPLDFSESSGKALDYALALSRTCGAQLHLVHVCDYDWAPPDFEVIPLALPHAEVTRRAKQRLKALAASHGMSFAPENLHVVNGRAYHEICRLAAKLRINLIVAATRGHTGLKHVILGSTAERVVQHAPCPVLIVREHERDILCQDEAGETVLRLQRILVPLDFSKCSLAGLEFGVPWAHFWNAQLVLYNSAPVSNLTPYGEFGAYGLSPVDPYVEEAADQSIREIASRMLERGVAVETVVETGPPAGLICTYAEQHEIDLIITSTHGTTGFVHAVIGSTAEHIVRYAHCPVLVVPTRKGEGGKL